MKVFYFILTMMLISACGADKNGAELDTTGFALQKISGDSYIGSKGQLTAGSLQKGTISNGQKNGVWLEFYEDGKIKTLTNYVDGKKNLIELNFNTTGRVEKSIGYLNDQLHGTVLDYEGASLKMEKNYKNGALDGEFKEYRRRNLIRSGHFKKGKQHGTLRYYDDDGNVTAEFIYENGEKIEGGIVEKE